MRLKRKPWVDEAIHEFAAFVFVRNDERTCKYKGRWQESFGRVAPLHVELGTGKGDFITQSAQLNSGINYIGIERQQDVLYTAAKKTADMDLANVRLAVFDIARLEELFAPHEVGRFYINFCDPWPKLRHAKRRLTHRTFLEKYRQLLMGGGEIFFKTDNRGLFDFSLGEFAAVGFDVNEVTYDLHADDSSANIMTEYERKFSERGMKICRAEVVVP